LDGVKGFQNSLYDFETITLALLYSRSTGWYIYCVAYTIVLIILTFLLLHRDPPSSAVKIIFHYFMVSESNGHKIVMALFLTLVFPRVIRTRGNLFLLILCFEVILAFTITIIILKYNYIYILTRVRILYFDEFYFHKHIIQYWRIHSVQVSIIILLQPYYNILKY
jgi:hypothetical protein